MDKNYGYSYQIQEISRINFTPGRSMNVRLKFVLRQNVVFSSQANMSRYDVGLY